ncbi:hypothetical protein MHBO_002112 [Bonamia ostreae]|uniref:Uncharacterized protein n=1 Tax=Bonamia ostreae TaxID=126728 RepID=A0ABV2ALA4_9EUKA
MTFELLMFLRIVMSKLPPPIMGQSNDRENYYLAIILLLCTVILILVISRNVSRNNANAFVKLFLSKLHRNLHSNARTREIFTQPSMLVRVDDNVFEQGKVVGFINSKGEHIFESKKI